MEAAERDRVIEALKAFFAKREEFAAAYLYGSVARGSATAKSDVDVGVLRRVAAPATLPSLLAEEEDRKFQAEIGEGGRGLAGLAGFRMPTPG